MGIETVLLVGSAISAVGTLSAASSQANAQRYNAQVADRNATVATQQGEAAAEQQRRVNMMRLGTIQAGYSASGITSEGSPIDVLAASAAQAELEAQNLKYNASLKALGYGDQAALDRTSAENTETAGMYSAAGSLLTGYGRSKAMGAGTGTPIPVARNGGYIDAGTPSFMEMG